MSADARYVADTLMVLEGCVRALGDYVQGGYGTPEDAVTMALECIEDLRRELFVPPPEPQLELVED